MGERAKFATKLGVIATTVGSAVGLGNIWRFPYEAGMNGHLAKPVDFDQLYQTIKEKLLIK